MTQLNLFDNLSNEAPKPRLMVYSVGGSFVFQNGIKNADFIVFNPLNKELVNEKTAICQCRYLKNFLMRLVVALKITANGSGLALGMVNLK